jgi:hypothetical protein
MIKLPSRMVDLVVHTTEDEAPKSLTFCSKTSGQRRTELPQRASRVQDATGGSAACLAAACKMHDGTLLHASTTRDWKGTRRCMPHGAPANPDQRRPHAKQTHPPSSGQTTAESVIEANGAGLLGPAYGGRACLRYWQRCSWDVLGAS